MLEEETTVDVENLRIDQNDAPPLRDLLVWRLGVTAMDEDCTPELLAEAAIIAIREAFVVTYTPPGDPLWQLIQVWVPCSKSDAARRVWCEECETIFHHCDHKAEAEDQ